jgi:predicted enzyme related to lactoylglutathione lyase
MSVKCNTVLYPVKDLDKARAVFSALFGTDPHVESPYYVGFSVDGHEIGLVPGGHDQGMSGPLPYYEVEDIEASLAALRGAGATIAQEPTEVGGGLLVARATDADGNDIGLRQPTAAS